MEFFTSGTADALVASVGTATGDTFANISPVVAIPIGIILALGIVAFLVTLFKKATPRTK